MPLSLGQSRWWSVGSVSRHFGGSNNEHRRFFEPVSAHQYDYVFLTELLTIVKAEVHLLHLLVSSRYPEPPHQLTFR